MHDRSPLGPDVGPKRIGSWRSTQENWARRQDPIEMDPNSGSKRIGSRAMIHFLWVLTQDQNWVQTQDPLVLGPDAGPKRIRSTQENWIWTKCFWIPKLIGSCCTIRPKAILGPSPTWPNSNRSYWGQNPTHDLFMYLIIHIIQNYRIKNLKTIKLWISYTNVIKLKYLLLPKIILY